MVKYVVKINAYYIVDGHIPTSPTDGVDEGSITDMKRKITITWKYITVLGIWSNGRNLLLQMNILSILEL